MGLRFYTRKWRHHEDFGFLCVCFLELGVVVLMATAQVLPNSMASTRKLEHLEAGKRRVWILLLFLLFLFCSVCNSNLQFGFDVFWACVFVYVFI